MIESKIKINKLNSIILHLHPAKVKNSALDFNRSFGLGGMSALLIVLLFLTGILLRFYYSPIPSKAYDSVFYIKNNVLFGAMIRNIHHWSAVFLIIISFLHLLRTFFTEAYREVRTVNWIIGMVLFLLVIFSNFTGYLLPWDQLAYWAVTVSTNILTYIPIIGESLKELLIGGDEIGGETLSIFFTLHTSAFPIMIIVMMAWHFWKVRKAGGILVPKKENDALVDTVPHLIKKEFVVALALMAVIFLFSAIFNAPLLDRANSAFAMNPTKAPWYFAGIQEMLQQFHPLVGGVIIPLLLLVYMFTLPFFKIGKKPVGNWFISEIGKSSAIVSGIISAVITIFLILLKEYVISFNELFGSTEFLYTGIIPFVVWLVMFLTLYYAVSKKYMLNENEKQQTIFVIIFSIFIVLTITGIFFRGIDMELSFPWNVL